MGITKLDGQAGKDAKKMIKQLRDAGLSPTQEIGSYFGLSTKPVDPKPKKSVNKNPSIADTVKSQVASVGMGLADAGAGIVQGNKYVADKINSGVNKVFGTNLDTKSYDRYNKEYEEANKGLNDLRSQGGRSGGDWYRGGTEMAATLPPYLLGGSGATLPIRAAKQGLVGAVVGGARYAEDADQRGKNVLGSAIGSMAGQVGGEYVARGVGNTATKLINAKKGNLAPAYKEIDDLGKQFDVPTTVGDINRGAFTKRAEVALEQVPVLGTGGFREGQNAAAVKATNSASDGLKSKMIAKDYEKLPQIRAAAAAGDRNAARVLNIVETAGDDVGRTLQASAEVRAFNESKIASRLYDKVDEAVSASGNDIVTPTKTTSVINDALDKQSASLAPDDDILRELSKVMERVNDTGVEKSFANMRLLRSQLGDLAEKYGAPINGNKAASKVFADARQAVDDDIADFAINSGNTAIKKAYQRADKFYKSAMQRSDKAIANAMKNNKPDEIYNAFVKTGKGDRANNFYQALDQKGQAALRYQMADEAIGKATNESTGNFSPAKFAGEFERMAEPYGNIFKGDDKKQMDGLVKLMRHIERAGQYKENPPTGNRVIPWLVAGATAINPVTAVKVGGLSLFARSMLTTRAGKNLLLAANKLPETQQAALDNILMNAAKVSAANGAKTGQEVSNSVAGTKVSDDNSKALTSF